MATSHFIEEDRDGYLLIVNSNLIKAMEMITSYFIKGEGDG